MVLYMWSINTDTLTLGINTITLTKDSEIIPKIKIFIKENNNKRELTNFEIDVNTISFQLNVNDSKYEIILRESNELFTFNIIVNKDVLNIEKINIKPFLSYLKGILTLSLHIKGIKNKHILNISGDFNKQIEVSKSKEHITFHHLIIDFSVINFKINNQSFSQIVIDPDKFPTSLIKLSNGIKLNKPCKQDLTIKVDGNDYIISDGNTEFLYNWNGVKTFNIYHNSILLFSQNIKKENYLPEVMLISDPLRIKSSIPCLRKIEVYLKGYNKVFILEAGKTEMLLNIDLKQGLRVLEVDKIINAISTQNKYTFLIN